MLKPANEIDISSNEYYFCIKFYVFHYEKISQRILDFLYYLDNNKCRGACNGCLRYLW